MSSSSADPAEQLNKRIQGLSQELQDLILDFTLAIKPGQFVIITKNYKPPKQLTINRKTRQELVAEYYSNSLFVIPRDDKKGAHASTAGWFGSLAPSIREHIKELRIWRHSFREGVCPRAEIICFAGVYACYYHKWIPADTEWLKNVRLLVNIGWPSEHTKRADQLEWYDGEQLRAMGSIV